MSIKAWSSTLLVLCFSFAAWAQNSSRYLEKPLPQGWGTETAHAIPGDDNMFDGQIQPVMTNGGRLLMIRCSIH